LLQLFVDALYTSPYALSAFVALKEKGLPFELQPINLQKKENYLAPYMQRSLTARVPTLVHDGFELSESSAISEYLDEIFSPGAYPALYPHHPQDRARARQIQAWLRSDLVSLREERPTHTIFIKPTQIPLSPAGRASAEKLITTASRLIKNPTSYLFDRWCIADTDLALMIQRLVKNGDTVPDMLASYARFQWQKPSVKAWLQLSKTR
jgi:glutathione S-transferase